MNMMLTRYHGLCAAGFMVSAHLWIIVSTDTIKNAIDNVKNIANGIHLTQKNQRVIKNPYSHSIVNYKKISFIINQLENKKMVIP